MNPGRNVISKRAAIAVSTSSPRADAVSFASLVVKSKAGVAGPLALRSAQVPTRVLLIRDYKLYVGYAVCTDRD